MSTSTGSQSEEMHARATAFSSGTRRPATGLQALCIVAGFHQRSADAVQLSSALGFDGIRVGDDQILLAAKELGLKARRARLTWERLRPGMLPLVVALSDGEFAVATHMRNRRIRIVDPRKPRPVFMEREKFESLWGGQVILVKTPLRWDNPNRPFGLLWFVPAILKHRRIMLEIMAASLVIQLFGLAAPFFTQIIIDKVLMHKSVPTLDVLAVGMLIIIVFEGVLNILQTQLLSHTSNRIDAVLGARLFKHLLRLPLRYFEVRRVGDTVARVRELETIRSFITSSSITIIIDLLFVGIFLSVMLLYSVFLTLVVVVSIVCLAALTLIIKPMMRYRLEEKFDRGAESQSYMVESVTGIQTIKAMALEPVMNRKWEILLARYVSAAFRASHLSGLGGALGQIVQRASTLAILWVGANLVMHGDLTVGQLIAFQMLSSRAISPVMRVVKLWQDFQQIGLSVERLGDIINTRPEPVMNPGKSALPAIKGAVKLENLRFRYYPDGPEILRSITLDIAPGTTVGIVGRSGSGKSTLAKLLQRLYLPESGRILIDDVDLQQADPMWLRRQIGVVLQENFLFNGSVRDNIAIHMPGLPMTRIVEVAKLAGAHEFILELQDGYDTQVGERGTALSGGQRQRIAIARALLSDPRILIFDEATSALDSESERIIQSNLAKICSGRTVFIVAHRLSTIHHADSIVVMDHGEIAEQGRHDELIGKEGIYRHLFLQQVGGLYGNRVA